LNDVYSRQKLKKLPGQRSVMKNRRKEEPEEDDDDEFFVDFLASL